MTLISLSSSYLLNKNSYLTGYQLVQKLVKLQ